MLMRMLLVVLASCSERVASFSSR